MDKHTEESQKEPPEKLSCLDCTALVCMSPIAFLVLILIALYNLLRFLLKAALLFIIVAINTPIAVMINSSILVLSLRDSSGDSSGNSNGDPSVLPSVNPRSDPSVRPSVNSRIDPRVTVGIELQIIVSDFFKVVAPELLLVLATGVITFYTAPVLVFYISMAVGVTAILLKWLNTSSLSKTAFSCICDGIGLNPMMFFFSFIGLFDIGCHPVAKCSFAARRAFLFVKDPFKDPNTPILDIEKGLKVSGIEQGQNSFYGPHAFKAVIDPEKPSIDFRRWNAFERGLFHLSPRIDFRRRVHGKYILKSSMVLWLHRKFIICEYPVERLELPEDYSESKANELYNFLVKLSEQDGFVTDKMRGRYEHSLTLLGIVDGVQKSAGYKISVPMDESFVVARTADLQH